MFIMNTKVSILLSWTILILSSICESGTENVEVNKESITTTIYTTIDSTTTVITESPYPWSDTLLVLCHCSPGEVMDDTGMCQHWNSGTNVPMELIAYSINQEPQHVDTKELMIIVNNTQCQDRQIELQEKEFKLRVRGDLLVTDGALRGLRVEDYCIHHQQIGEQVKVTARGCVSIPEVPRCCPPGEYMLNADCVPKPVTFLLFNPPLSTGMHGYDALSGAPFPWPGHTELVGKPNCPPEQVLRKVKLDGHKAYLAVLPKLVYLTWHPEGQLRKFRPPKDYCVDVLGDYDTYFAFSCQKDLETFCMNKMCTRKCCADDQALSEVDSQCVFSNLSFTPPFPSLPSSLEIIYGFPTCEVITDITNFQLLQDGTLVHNENKYSYEEFCTDTLIKEDSTQSSGVLACLKEIQLTTWRRVRKVLTPVCLGLSCTSLGILLLLHFWIPNLSEKEGKYQLFHAVSLFVGYFAYFVIEVTPNEFMKRGSVPCFSAAFVMQFGYLSTFYWLNIMCFDVWRLFRKMSRNMYSPTRPMPAWIYFLYALGGPLIITVITMIVQFLAPKDIEGLIHPQIGEERCWFLYRNNKGLVAYFHGPIAVLFLLNFIFISFTYHYLKVIRGDYSESGEDKSGYTISSVETTRKTDFFAAFWDRFFLLALMAGCWMTEMLSLMPLQELWAVTDILTNLQGVFVVIVFFTHHNKRGLLKEKLPSLFRCGDVCMSGAKTAQTNINTTARRFSTQISSSSLVSSMTSFSAISSGKSSSSTFNLNENETSVDLSSKGITPLSLKRTISNDPNSNNM